MNTPRNLWLLKVIAGPHQGAEVGVRLGKMLVGSDDECDVVLHDVLVAPQHLEIEASAAGITVAPLGGRVFVDGKRVREARQIVPDFSFVSVGGSHLIIGPDDGKWPLLSAADVPELERESEAPAVSPVAEASPSSVAPVPVSSAGTFRQPVDAQTRTRASFGIGIGVLLLIVWFFAYLKYSGGSDGEAERLAANSKPADRARAVVASMGLGDSIKIEEPGGRVAISGYVDTEARQRELQAAFRQAVPGVNTRIYSLEKIASSARALLEDESLPLEVTSLSEGRLKVAGKLPAADRWVRMRQTLRRSVPGIGEIEDNVEIETPRMATPAKSRLVQVSAPPAYVPDARPSLPPRAGTLPVPSADPVATTDYMISADTIDTIQSTIATIVLAKAGGGPLSYVRLSSGGVYFENARLPFGGRITRIDEAGVTVDEKGSTRILQQGDLLVKPKDTLSGVSANSTISP